MAYFDLNRAMKTSNGQWERAMEKDGRIQEDTLIGKFLLRKVLYNFLLYFV